MKKLLIVLLLALTVLKVALVLARGPAAIEMDAAQYWHLATMVKSGDLFFTDAPIANRTPLYPWFLAIIRACSGATALKAIVVIQGLFFVGSAWIAAVITERITKLRWAKFWTLLVYLPATSSLVFHTTVLSEPLFIFLLMVNLLAVMNYARQDSAGHAAWVGATLGLLLLARPIAMLLFIPHLLFVLVVHWRRRSRLGAAHPHRIRLPRRAVHLAIAASVVLATLAPWLVRNQLMFGKPS